MIWDKDEFEIDYEEFKKMSVSVNKLKKAKKARILYNNTENKHKRKVKKAIK